MKQLDAMRIVTEIERLLAGPFARTLRTFDQHVQDIIEGRVRVKTCRR